MEWNRTEIEFFPQVVVRTPTLPLGERMDSFKEILSIEAFAKALYHANPKVYNAAMDWLAGKTFTPKKEKRIKKTLYNYWCRMHSNCTPFGFFAQVALAKWDNKNALDLDGQRHTTRLDMELLQLIANQLEQLPPIKENIKYFPNNTRYPVGDKLRFNELVFEKGKMSYRLSAVDADGFLMDLLEFAAQGKTIDELSDFIDDGEYERSEIVDFILELIKEQLLFSNLKLNIIGQNPLERLIDTLENLKQEKIADIIASLRNIAQQLEQFEKGQGFIAAFDELHRQLSQMLPEIDPRKMVSIDSYGVFKEEGGKIDISLQQNIYEAIKIVSSFDQRLTVPFLEEFKQKFGERYENAVVPLMQVIDTEFGLSFGPFKYLRDNLFMDKLDVKQGPQGVPSYLKENNPSKILFYRKYMECLKGNRRTIHLEKSDFEAIEGDISKLAPTCQVIFNYIGGKNDLLALETVGNSSAGNLISRFSSGYEGIKRVMRDIAVFEQEQCGPNHIVAEIAHIPEYRIGNLTFRATFRDYEIPIVTPSILPKTQQVSLSDLYVTVRHGQILLFSQKLQKYVLPKLSNAHNYSKNTLPIYMFLSELSYQGIHPSIQLDLGLLPTLGKFLPRIQYKNIILSKACWNLVFDDFLPLYNHREQLSQAKIDVFREKMSLAPYTNFKGATGDTLVDWKDKESVYFFLQKINPTSTIQLVELPFCATSMPVRDNNGKTLNNEVIAFFKNKAHKHVPRKPLTIPEKTQRLFFPGDAWLYYKIYCGQKTFGQLVAEQINPLVKHLQAKNLTTKIFFLPFRDPEFHLRIRLLTSPGHLEAVQSLLAASIGKISPQGQVSKVQIDTYKRELERYGPKSMAIAESIFSIDSLFLLENHSAVYNQFEYFVPLLAIKQLDTLLDAFGRSLSFKLKFFEALSKAYSDEFLVGENLPLKREIDSTMLKNRKKVAAAMKEEFPFLPLDIQASFIERLNNYRKNMQGIYRQNKAVFSKEGFLEDFLPSIVHMHCIRCFPDRPRQNELFAYKAISLYYKKQSYLQ